jgi:hypothetical protein
VRIAKRFLKRIAIGFGIVLGMLLIINGVLAWKAQRRLDQLIAELLAAGEPTSLADLATTPAPPEKNAYVFLREAEAPLEKFGRDQAAFYATELGNRLGGMGYETPNNEQRIAMRAILDAYPTMMPAIAKATACVQYASLIDFNLPPSQFFEQALSDAQAFRNLLVWFASWETAVTAAEGKPNEAVGFGVQLLRLSRLYDQRSTLMSHFVSVACSDSSLGAINEILRHHEIAPSVRADLDAELALHSATPLVGFVRRERAFSISRAIEQTTPIVVRWPILNRMLDEIDAESQVYSISRLPLDQLHPQWNPATKENLPPQLGSISGRLIERTLTTAITMDLRSLARDRCLRVVNALGEYRARTGKEAESIEQLSLPHDAIVDPCTGKPLRMTKTDAGWIVYSVYRNGEDDGGKFHAEDGPWGFGPPGYENDERR